METLDFLIATIPIFCFGMLPVLATLIGGKAIEQSLGISIGSIVFATVVLLFKPQHWSFFIFIIGLISGIFWGIGSVYQFRAIKYLGVSKSIPISNGTQIIATSLMGILLGDWVTEKSKIFGFIAIAFIIIGIIFTSYRQSNPNDKGKKINWGKGITLNLIATLGFTLYISVLKYFKIDGWTSLFPQSIGQFIGVSIISFLIFKNNPFNLKAVKNAIVGIIWAIGNLALLISQLKIGLAVAYPMSQAAVIVSIIGGVYINKEKKTKKEWLFAIVGMITILLGLIFIYFSSRYDLKQ